MRETAENRVGSDAMSVRNVVARQSCRRHPLTAAEFPDRGSRGDDRNRRNRSARNEAKTLAMRRVRRAEWVQRQYQ